MENKEAKNNWPVICSKFHLNPDYKKIYSPFKSNIKSIHRSNLLTYQLGVKIQKENKLVGQDKVTGDKTNFDDAAQERDEWINEDPMSYPENRNIEITHAYCIY